MQVVATAEILLTRTRVRLSKARESPITMSTALRTFNSDYAIPDSLHGIAILTPFVQYGNHSHLFSWCPIFFIPGSRYREYAAVYGTYLNRYACRLFLKSHFNAKCPDSTVLVCCYSASYAGLNEWEEAAHDAAQCIKVNKNFVKGEFVEECTVVYTQSWSLGLPQLPDTRYKSYVLDAAEVHMRTGSTRG